MCKRKHKLNCCKKLPLMLPAQLKLLLWRISDGFRWLSAVVQLFGGKQSVETMYKKHEPMMASTPSSRTDLIFYSAWMTPLYNSHFLMPCLSWSLNLSTQCRRLTGEPHGCLCATWGPPQRLPWWYWAQDHNGNPRLTHDSLAHESPLNIYRSACSRSPYEENNWIVFQSSERGRCQRYKAEAVRTVLPHLYLLYSMRTGSVVWRHIWMEDLLWSLILETLSVPVHIFKLYSVCSSVKEEQRNGSWHIQWTFWVGMRIKKRHKMMFRYFWFIIILALRK